MRKNNLDSLKVAYLKGDVSAVEWLDFVLSHEEDELHQTAMELSDEELTSFLAWSGDEDWMVTDHETRRNPDYYIDLAKRKWDEVLAAEINEWKAQGYVQSEEDKEAWVIPGTDKKGYLKESAIETYDICLTPEEVAGYYLWSRLGEKQTHLRTGSQIPMVFRCQNPIWKQTGSLRSSVS